MDENLISEFNEQLKITNKVIIFDDVITTGATFKSIELVMKAQFPKIKVIGIFIARIVHRNAVALPDDFDYLA